MYLFNLGRKLKSVHQAHPILKLKLNNHVQARPIQTKNQREEKKQTRRIEEEGKISFTYMRISVAGPAEDEKDTAIEYKSLLLPSAHTKLTPL